MEKENKELQQIQNKHINLRIGIKLLQGIEKTKGNSRSDKFKRVLKAGLNNTAVDNCDYSDLIGALFELKKEIAPIGANLNQLALYLNRGNIIDGVENIAVLDELREQFKQWMKITKYLERDLKKK